jgi:oxaloacetate decarboxylase gamma subunit
MSELMGNGVELMFVGMGIVYLFLTMLVLAINLMSGVIRRFFPEPPPTTVVLPNVPNNGNIDKQTIAAITAAVYQHRK